MAFVLYPKPGQHYFKFPTTWYPAIVSDHSQNREP